MEQGLGRAPGMEAERRERDQNGMEQGLGSARGLEAGSRGIEAIIKSTEQQAAKMTEQMKQQKMFMNNWEQQQRINNVMMKGESMGVCPRMISSQTLESWVEEVRLWSRQCPEEELSSLKYLSFVNSVRESESLEMKRFVEIAVMENTESDSIDKIMDLVIKTLGNSNLESASRAWKDFVELEQREGESICDFVLRFENTEAELKNAKLPIPSTALAIQILMKSNLTTMSKENVLSKVDLDNRTEMHTNVKKTLRELKSLSMTDKVETENLTKAEKDPPRLEIKREHSKRMESDRHYKRYSKRYEESSKRMEDEEWNGKALRKLEYDNKGKDYSKRMEREDTRRNYPWMKTHQYNKNIPKGWKAKEVFNVSYKPLEEVLSNIESIRTF